MRASVRWLVVGVAACAAHHEPQLPVGAPARGEPWPEADAMFRRDPRWLGGDGAYSVDLGGDRTLWLFGDTFVARAPGATRADAKMVRNTVGVQRGRDPTRATLDLAWRTEPSGEPASFFEERGEHWHWPGHGVRLGAGKPLILFLSVLRATPGGLGFASAGWRVVRIDDPDAVPSAWAPVWLEPVGSADVVVGSAVVRRDGFVVALAYRADGGHAGHLARFREDDLLAGRVVPEWWNGGGWRAGDAGAEGATVVLDDAGSECSLHHDAALGSWVHVASRGFGASTIAVRTAPKLEGPWSAPVSVFTPPESRAPRPFVYAAKAHPELDGGGALVVTYAANSFTFADLFAPEGRDLYWPRVVRLRP